MSGARSSADTVSPQQGTDGGSLAVEVKAPRVSDVPLVVASSRRYRRYERTSRSVSLEGLSTGDFEPVFRLVAALSVRLKSRSIGRGVAGSWKSAGWAGVYLGQGEACADMRGGGKGGRRTSLAI